jgi:hypothetical protein
MVHYDDEGYPPVRSFVFTKRDPVTFGENLASMGLNADLVHVKFAARCDPIGSPPPDDGYNYFVALDSDTEAEADRLALYFASTLAIGKHRGIQGLKNI